MKRLSSPRSAVASSRSSAEESVYRKINRRLLPFLLLCYTFAYLDRVNIGFAKLHMQEDIPAITEAVFGIGAGLFFLAYAILEIPSNMVMHRIGARKTITRIMVLWGIVSASMLFVRDEFSFYALRILLGIFEAGFAPGIILYLTYWFPAKRMAAAMGIYMLAGPIGSILGSGVSAAIISAMDDLLGMAGWQWMFLVQGIPCLLLGYLFWKLMYDRPDDAPWLTAAEKAIVRRVITETDAARIDHRFVDVLKNPAVYVMAVAYFGIMCGIYAVSFWLPTILSDNGIRNNLTVGLLAAIPYVLTIPTMIFLSKSSDRTQDRHWHTIFPTILAAVGLTLAAFTSSNFLFSFTALCVAICSAWGAYTVFWAVPSQHFGGTAAAGGIALINTVGILGGFVAPTLLGFVKQATGSTQGGLLAMVGLLGLSALALFLLPKSLKLKRNEVLN
ncbi:MFS transporter [Glutamicibacter creatinolyticus]|uniref:MFS transporter n=1 Tax=Glutamicibacter creatinolyticus TaxID=162496 RepID=A0A5B7WU93_9MICC|nr:MFS transporter [Glutamicibacter creatinolyticus]QCY46855.1 MFS transporter [Glutamicibacter creatinolyticus]